MLSIFLPGFISPVTAQYETPLLSHGPIAQLVLGSEQIVQGVFYLLFFSSVASWGIIFYKFYQVYSARRLAGRFRAAFAGSDDLTSLYAASLKMNANPLIAVFHAGYQELRRLARTPTPPTLHHSPAAPNEGRMEKVERAMRRAVREQAAWLEHALPFLATTASTAPFIGLFGTVCGIVHAFHGLSLAQSTSIQAVAPGIAEALVATAVGLFVAIPAVVAFNHFSLQVQRLHGEMETLSTEFLTLAEGIPLYATPGDAVVRDRHAA